MQTLKGNDKEVITVGGTIQKAIDITKAGIKQGDQTYQQLLDELTNALNFNADDMFANFSIVSKNNWSRADFDMWWAEEFPHVQAMPIDPVFGPDDSEFLSRIAAVAHANMSFNLQDLYYTQLDKTLIMVNHPAIDAEYLDTVVGISSRAANNIEAYRAASDGQLNTSDDLLFESIDALDMIAYVGPITVNKIQIFTESWEAGNPPETADPEVVFLNQDTTTFVLLDITVALRKDAAANIIARRNGPDGIYGSADDQPFVSVDDVLSVSRVGNKTMETITNYLSNM